MSYTANEHPVPLIVCQCLTDLAVTLYQFNTLMFVFTLPIGKGAIYYLPGLQEGKVAQANSVMMLTDHLFPQMRKQQLRYLCHSCFVLV